MSVLTYVIALDDDADDADAQNDKKTIGCAGWGIWLCKNYRRKARRARA